MARSRRRSISASRSASAAHVGGARVEAELAVPPYLDVADLGLLAHEAHDGAQKLAHAFRRRVLLEFQRAEDLALRGRRRGGEGDDEVCDSSRHLNAGARIAAVIGEKLPLAKFLIKTAVEIRTRGGPEVSGRRAGELYAAETMPGRRRRAYGRNGNRL